MKPVEPMVSTICHSLDPSPSLPLVTLDANKGVHTECNFCQLTGIFRDDYLTQLCLLSTSLPSLTLLGAPSIVLSLDVGYGEHPRCFFLLLENLTFISEGELLNSKVRLWETNDNAEHKFSVDAGKEPAEIKGRSVAQINGSKQTHPEQVASFR